MGFEKELVQIQGATAQGPDIIVTYNLEKKHKLVGLKKKSIKIIIQCKCAEEKGTKLTNLHNLIRIYESYVKEYKADLALLTLDGYNIPDAYRKPKKLDDIRKKKKVVYWDNQTLVYYNRLSNALKDPYSLYSFFNDIGYRIQLSNTPLKVRALSTKQHDKGKEILTFAIPVDDLLKIGYVFHRGSVSPEAYQRLLTARRLGAVGKFVSKETSYLANNIVVAFESPVKYSKGMLEIPQITCSAWIIDGQHRLYGFLKIPESADADMVRKKFKLIVSGIKGSRGKTGRLMQANLFREINEYQQKIERNLLLDLYHYLEIDDKRGIFTRVDIAKKLRKTSPFIGRLRILPIQIGAVTLATIVDYSPFEKIVKNYGTKTHAICKNYFVTVSNIFANEWQDPKKYILCTNKGVRMLLSLLVKILRHNSNLGKKPTPERFKYYLTFLRKSTISEDSFFLTKSYSGKALGAGAPDKISTTMWATIIHDSVKGFLIKKELEDVFLGDATTIEELESTLRECLTNAMGDKYFENLPDDIREEAERRKVQESKKFPWKKVSDPPEAYLNFSAFRVVMTSRKRWTPYFASIFPSKDWFTSRMHELEGIRNRLHHFRPLDQSEKSKLAMYSEEITKTIENWKAQQTSSPTTSSP